MEKTIVEIQEQLEARGYRTARDSNAPNPGGAWSLYKKSFILPCWDPIHADRVVNDTIASIRGLPGVTIAQNTLYIENATNSALPGNEARRPALVILFRGYSF